MRFASWISTAVLAAAAYPASSADLPRKAPDYTINLTGGQSLTLSQYKGKVVAMTFIYTTCSRCQETIRVLKTMQNDYGPRGLQVLASAINPDAPSLLSLFIKGFSPPFPVGYSTAQSAATFIQPTGEKPEMPLMAFIDRSGMIRAQTEGEEPFFHNLEPNLRKQIEALLKTGAR